MSAASLCIHHGAAAISNSKPLNSCSDIPNPTSDTMKLREPSKQPGASRATGAQRKKERWTDGGTIKETTGQPRTTSDWHITEKRHEVSRWRLHCAREHQDKETTQPNPKSSSIELRRTSQTADARGPELARTQRPSSHRMNEECFSKTPQHDRPMPPKIPESYYRRHLSQNGYGLCGVCGV